MTEITLTKKIAKHGNQNIIVIPQFLKDRLRHKSVVEVKIRVLEEADGNG